MKTKTTIVMLVVIFIFFMMLPACTQPESSKVKFQPDPESLFKITFDYPENWNWQIPPRSTTDSFSTMYVLSPYPASTPDVRKASRLLSIAVILTNTPSRDVEETITRSLSISEEYPEYRILLDNRIVEMDQHLARWITEKRVPDLEEFDQQLYIAEEIWLLAEDRYYSIFLIISEDELNGPFHTEFKDMVESIKFLP